VSPTGELFLGVIALAVMVLAVVQTVVLIAGIRLVKRVEQLAVQIDQDLKPLIASLTTLSGEALRAATLATRQVERLDRVFGELAARVDHTLAAAEEFVTGPARQGMAIVAGVKAVFDAFKGLREASRRRTAAPRPAIDEEESLFIG